MGFKSNIISIFMVILLTFALFIFAIQFVTINDPDGSNVLSNDQDANSTLNSIKGNVSDFNTLVNEQKTAFQEDTPTPTLLYLIFKTAYSIPLKFFTIAVNSFSLIFQITFPQIFGSESSSELWVIVAVIGIIVTSIVLFSAIKFVRTGQDEL